MIGITTDGGIENQEKSKSNEVPAPDDCTPQRSIMDFFKSPAKNVAKPRDLLGYFSKADSSSEKTKINGHSTKDDGSKNKEKRKCNGNDAKTTKTKKPTKRKRSEASNFNDSIDEFDAPHHNGDVHQKAKKTKVHSKKTTKSVECVLSNGGSEHYDVKEPNSEESDDWKYKRKPNDKLQAEFDVLAEEFSLSDSEVKGRIGKRPENKGEAGSDKSSVSVNQMIGEEDDDVVVIDNNDVLNKTPSHNKTEDNPATKCEKAESMESVGQDIEWKRTLDLEKIKTPKTRKGKEAKGMKDIKKKKKKMKLKKPEKPRAETPQNLNLSDICDNMADVSILSDTSQGDRSILKEKNTEEKKDLETDKEVLELSFADFLKSEGMTSGSQKENEVQNKIIIDESDENSIEYSVEGGSASKKKSNDQADASSKKANEAKTEAGESKVTSDLSKEAELAEHEISYADYLNTLSKDVEDTENTEENSVGKVEPLKDNASDQSIKMKSKTSDEEIPMPKHYPSITNFFKKVEGGKLSNDKKTNRLAKVTVKADVHSEPHQKSPVPNEAEKSQKKSPVSGSKMDTDIQVLGTEVITVDTPVSKRKSIKNDVNSDDVETKEDLKRKKGRPRKSLLKELNEREIENKTKAEMHDDNDMVTSVIDREDDTSVCIIEDTETANYPDEQNREFLQSSVSQPALNKKTSQATFSFGKAGFQMKKATLPVTRVRKSLKESVSEDLKMEGPLSESTPLKTEWKRKAGRKKKTDITVVDVDSDCTGEPQRRSLRSSRSTIHLETSMDDSKVFERNEESDSTRSKKKTHKEMSVAERRKLLRRKYSVALLDNIGKQGSPIRIKLTRYSKSSSSQDDTMATTTVQGTSKVKVKKTSAAQKLLKKAKSRKSTMTKETKEKELVESPVKTEGRRRSSRLSDKHKSMEEVLIVDDDSVDSCYTPVKQKTKKGRKPKSAVVCETPKKEVKSTKKLASIFLKKGKKEEVSSPAKRVLDPEAEKRRRAFLMSDVPDELIKQTATISSVAVNDYPPFPTINHTQQISERKTMCGKNLWDLPDVCLKYCEIVDECKASAAELVWSDTIINKYSKEENLDHIKNFHQHEKFEEKVIDLLLTEIGQLCPSYPVRKMYSLLKEKNEEIEEEVVDGDKNQKKTAKEEKPKEEPPIRKRRSLRLRPVIEVLDVIGSPEKDSSNDDTVKDKQDSEPPTLTFVEKYQPLHSSEVVGNSGVIKKLKSWLMEWKERVNKEARKARMMLMKKSKNKPRKEEDSNDWWADDLSDFDMSSDDSEDDDRLCNTVMLTGATGVGKTATVYALAQELGFKVFEVNASSSRNGKRILSQLQEATQSHQVSKTTVGGSNTPVKIGKKSGGLSAEPGKKMPTAFTNLFKIAENQSKTDKGESSKSGRKKRKRDGDNEDQVQEKASKKKKEDKQDKKKGKSEENSKKILLDSEGGRSLNLSSTSLILFDEVDLVFEQDKGFWAAIQNFMSTTKIPIILTSNDSKLHHKFEGTFEHYSFKIPSLIASTIYLQLISLVENIRTDPCDIFNLISMYNGDLRRALQTLQLWILSGGGTTLKKLAINIKMSIANQSEEIHDKVTLHEKKESEETSRQDVGNGDDDDFVMIKPLVRRKPLLLFDEDSNSLPPQLPESEIMTEEKIITEGKDVGNVPVVHSSSFSTVLGYRHGILDVLKRISEMKDVEMLNTTLEACLQYHSLKTRILYNHHLDLLPMAQVKIDSNLLTKSSRKMPQKFKRKRIKSYLYDSEGSCDESDVKNCVLDTGKNDSASSEKIPLEDKPCSKNSTEVIRSLTSFYEFYDAMSLTDLMRLVEDKISGCSVSFGKEDHKGSLHIGLDDRFSNLESSPSQKLSERLCAEIEFQGFRKLQQQQKEVMNSMEDVDEDLFSVPVTACCEMKTLTMETARCYVSSKAVVKKVADNIKSNLPLTLLNQSSVTSLDYIPMLRSMSKCEQVREAAKAKRRFHHYFDNIGLPLKSTTIGALCSSFP